MWSYYSTFFACIFHDCDQVVFDMIQWKWVLGILIVRITGLKFRYIFRTIPKVTIGFFMKFIGSKHFPRITLQKYFITCKSTCNYRVKLVKSCTLTAHQFKPKQPSRRLDTTTLSKFYVMHNTNDNKTKLTYPIPKSSWPFKKSKSHSLCRDLHMFLPQKCSRKVKSLYCCYSNWCPFV